MKLPIINGSLYLNEQTTLFDEILFAKMGLPILQGASI